LAVGPSNNAIFKEPAQKRKLEAGDMVIIPAGVYHGCTDVADHIEYVSVRSDPKHVLPAGYVSPPPARQGCQQMKPQRDRGMNQRAFRIGWVQVVLLR
jgi:hypothetical protein